MQLDNNQPFSFSKNLIKGEMLFGFWNIFVKALTIVNSLIIIRHLSIFQFGAYKLIFAFVALAGGFLFDGLNGVVLNDVIRFLAEKKEALAKRLFMEYALIKILLGCFLTLAVFASANLVAQIYDKDIASLIRIVSFLFIFDAAQSVIDVFLKSTLRFSLAAAQSIIREGSKFFILLGFILFSFLGTKEVIIAHAGSFFIVVLVALICFLKSYSKSIKSFLAEGESNKGVLFGIVKTYGKWAILTQYINGFSKNIKPWLIKFFLNTEAVGIFSVATTLISFLEDVFPLKVFSSLLPREIANRERLRHIFSRAMKYVGFFGIGLAILGFFFVPVAVSLLFSKYNMAIPYFRLMLLGLPLYGFSKITGSVIISLREQKFLFLRPFIYALSVTVFLIIFLPLCGLWGAVIEFVMTSILMVIFFYQHIIKLMPELKLKIKEFFVFDAYDRYFLKHIYNYFLSLMKNYLPFLKTKN